MRRLPAIVFSAAMVSGMITAVSLSAAAPASAAPATTSSPTGCSGQSCVASIYGQIQVTGSSNVTISPGHGGGSGTFPVPQCWMQPFLNAKQMLAWWNQQSESTLGSGGVAYLKYVTDIQKYAKENAPGMWWEPEGTFTGMSNGCIVALPLLEWVPAGQPPKNIAQWIPPRFLAEYAAASVIIHKPVVRTTPANKTFVSVPTSVHVISPVAPAWATASIFHGAETETVNVNARNLTIAVNLAATPYPGTSVCRGPAGSTAITGNTPACGFIFHEPSTGAVDITGTQDWVATWRGVRTNAQPAPAIGNWLLGAVDEIQSTNLPGRHTSHITHPPEPPEPHGARPAWCGWHINAV